MSDLLPLHSFQLSSCITPATKSKPFTSRSEILGYFAGYSKKLPPKTSPVNAKYQPAGEAEAFWLLLTCSSALVEGKRHLHLVSQSLLENTPAQLFHSPRSSKQIMSSLERSLSAMLPLPAHLQFSLPAHSRCSQAPAPTAGTTRRSGALRNAKTLLQRSTFVSFKAT